MPRRRIIATAPGGGGTPPPTGGGTVTVPLPERKMVQELTNLLRVVEAHHNHQMVGVEELVHYSQKGVEECLSDWQVEEELCHLVVMEVVMEMVMIMEEVVGHLPPRGNGGNGSDGGDDGDGGGGDSLPQSDHGQP